MKPKIDFDSIILKHGLNGLPFGISTEVCFERLGEPSYKKVGPSECEGDKDLEWQYESEGLSFTFYSDASFRLGCISSSRRSLTLKEVKLFGLGVGDIITFITEGLGAEPTEKNRCLHENGIVQDWIEVDSLDISFWFENGKLTKIDWFSSF